MMILNIHISSASMAPTLEVNSNVIGTRIEYLSNDLTRFDIIAFEYPLDSETIYIKRIIGLLGEHLEIKEGYIYINYQNEPITENYLKEDWTVDNTDYIFDIPPDSYLVLGDNRNNSEDSRNWREMALQNKLTVSDEEAAFYSYVKEESIVAKAWLKYSPTFLPLIK